VDKIEGFDWDAANVVHILHQQHLDVYLVVVFTIRRKLFRTVTAYEMNATERKKYAPQIA